MCDGFFSGGSSSANNSSQQKNQEIATRLNIESFVTDSGFTSCDEIAPEFVNFIIG